MGYEGLCMGIYGYVWLCRVVAWLVNTADQERLHVHGDVNERHCSFLSF